MFGILRERVKYRKPVSINRSDNTQTGSLSPEMEENKEWPLWDILDAGWK